MEYPLALHSILVAWVVAAWLSWTIIVAHWISDTSRPWMTRCTALFLSIAPVLAFGAQEIFWMLLLLGTLSVIWVRSGHWFAGRGQSDEPPRRRTVFSIAACLYATAMTAAAIVIFRQTPILDWSAWRSLLLIALTMSLLSAVLHNSSLTGFPFRLRVAAVVAISLVAATVLAVFDWLLIALFDLDFPGWPPEAYLALFMAPKRPFWLWFGLTVTVVLVVLLFNSIRLSTSGVRKARWIICLLFFSFLHFRESI